MKKPNTTVLRQEPAHFLDLLILLETVREPFLLGEGALTAWRLSVGRVDRFLRRVPAPPMQYGAGPCCRNPPECPWSKPFG
jgi:hypothetical protein